MSAAKRRSWVSIGLVIVLIGMTLTGVMSYAFAYDATTAGIHTWFGLAFVLLMVLHLTHNGRSLLSYLRRGNGKRYAALSAALAAVVVFGVTLEVPPMSSLLRLGQDLRRSMALEDGSYQILRTHIGKHGQAINIELRGGRHYRSTPQPLLLGLTFTTVPQVAFWVEDLNGRHLETLYVTKKSSDASFVPAGEPFTTTTRPEALPYWAHKRGVRYDDHLAAGRLNGDLDAITGATPRGDYDVRSVVTAAPKRFRVLMEINRSFDFNQYYARDRFPNDPIYSGSGSSGQPSVVYAADIDLDSVQRSYLLAPIGHGHHSGRDGVLYRDMTGIDTALKLVERVTVDVPRESS